MIEFLLPTYQEWLQEYQGWEWPESYDRRQWDSARIFDRLELRIRNALSLPYQTDYYRPERAALVLGDLWVEPPPVRHGGLAYSAWMVRQNPEDQLTSFMGAEICRGFLHLKKEFHLDGVTASIRALLQQYEHELETEPSAGSIVADWLKQTKGRQPLAAWLRHQARSDDAAHAASHHAD
jgi:hypothetical protein